MDNQHKHIAGYRDLDANEIAQINALKQVEADLSHLLDVFAPEPISQAQARWKAMARSYLEIGMMFAIKAVARPIGGMGNPQRDPGAETEASSLDALLGASDGEEVAREEQQERDYQAAFIRAQRAAKSDPRPEPEKRDPSELTRDGRPKLTEEQVAYERDAIGHDPYASPRAKADYEAAKARDQERRHDAEQAAQKAAGTYQRPRDPLEALNEARLAAEIDHDAVAHEAAIAAEHEAMMRAEFEEAVAASRAEAEPAPNDQLAVDPGFLPDVEPAPLADEQYAAVQLDEDQEREAQQAEEEINRPRTKEEYRQLATPAQEEPLKYYEAFPSPEAAAEYERQVAANRPDRAKPPGEPHATFGSGGARFVPTTSPQKDSAGRFVPTTGPQEDGGARFVPTPDNPADDPMSAEGRPPRGERDLP